MQQRARVANRMLLAATQLQIWANSPENGAPHPHIFNGGAASALPLPLFCLGRGFRAQQGRWIPGLELPRGRRQRPKVYGGQGDFHQHILYKFPVHTSHCYFIYCSWPAFYSLFHVLKFKCGKHYQYPP